MTGVNDPASKDIEGVGGLELLFDRFGVGGIESAHDDVRMGRQFVKKRTGVGAQNLDFDQGQGGQEVGQAPDTGGAQPRAKRDAAASPRGGTGVEDFTANGKFGLVLSAEILTAGWRIYCRQ